MVDFDLRLIDCLQGLDTLPSDSIDLCLTDPPYFLDGLDDRWNREQINRKGVNEKGTIKGLPAGMKFDRQQGRAFGDFIKQVADKVYRVMKPGGFFLAFSSSRLYHRLGVAIEDAGFDIRDMIAWIYTHSQAKAFSLNHFVHKGDLSALEKTALIAELAGWKTPQLKPAIEPICFAQKPLTDTFLNNWRQHKVGLIDVRQTTGEDSDKFPANVVTTERIEGLIRSFYLYAKPTEAEKGDFNDHLSVKPIKLCEHLIRLLTTSGATVLDPFNGSGTTGVAAIGCDRRYIGFEIDQHYHDISMQRYHDVLHTRTFTVLQ